MTEEINMDNFVKMHISLSQKYKSFNTNKQMFKSLIGRPLLEAHLCELDDVIMRIRGTLYASEILLKLEFREEKLLSTITAINNDKYTLEKLYECREYLIDALKS